MRNLCRGHHLHHLYRVKIILTCCFNGEDLKIFSKSETRFAQHPGILLDQEKENLEDNYLTNGLSEDVD